MKAEIINNSRAPQGVHCVDGLKFIEPGETKEIDVADDYVDRLKSLSFFTVRGDLKSSAGSSSAGDTPEMAKMRKQFDASWNDLVKSHDKSKADLEEAGKEIAEFKERVAELERENEGLKAGTSDIQKFEAKHRGGGSYSIMSGDKEIAEKLSKADAETFNAMSDQDKAEYVAALKKD